MRGRKEDKIADEAFQKFRQRIKRRSESRSTDRTYSGQLLRFLKWVGMEPNEFLEAVKAGRIEVEEELNGYIDDLAERGLSPSTQKGAYSAVKTFLEVNLSKKERIEIDWDHVDLPKSYGKIEDKTPRHEELKRILAYGDVEDGALVLVATSSGCREGTLASLTLGDIDLDTYPDIGVIRVKASQAKERVKYVTFITPEAKETLRAYLDLRRRKGENFSPSTPLFGFMGKPVLASALVQRWNRLLEKSGFNERSGPWRVYRFHTLRKFFRKALEDARMTKSYRERLMGHTGEYLDKAYLQSEELELLELYRQAIPYLQVYAVQEKRDLKKEREQAAEALRQLGIDPERWLRVAKEKAGREFTITEEIEKLLVKTEVETTLRETRKEQEIVDENTLSNHLSHGWRFVACLSNGRYIVEREV